MREEKNITPTSTIEKITIMHWIAPSEKSVATATLEKQLWDAADQFRANSGLKAQEYSGPILGLIFLRFAEVRFAAQRVKLEQAASSSRRGSRVDEPAAYHAEGILYLSAEARFDSLLKQPEGVDIGAKINDAMREIEKGNDGLGEVLPKTYHLFTSTLLKELLKKISEIPAAVDYDAFGRIYEYFLGEFARTEGQKGGEFYTPSCIITGASSTPPAVRAVCLFSLRALWRNTRRIPARSWPFMASRRPTKPGDSAG